ncbi:alpha/beta hydrolase [Oscillatoria sp. FACHB-1406]|uniref:alpha/beta fold hydrolase n=1 Tax=Oscillatoria sp. FACHB-1406 TaxID=2692846 RepID=UPI001685D77D|nr:alpha/beta hydrolase [Oscillatoria sp. FACHB-1406]MBD2579244.1 alpha/beta hydrolase [Oscillatoria sp. FACHB-1406]
MSKYPTALWLNTSESFQPFEAPLLRYLFARAAIARWEYSQSPDEASSLKIASVLLHDYLKQCDRPLHLIGHGTAGLLGLLYAREHPERVRSLTLLGVGAHPEIDWQAHYYTLCAQLPCDRVAILAQIVRYLFGEQNYRTTKCLIEILEKDLLHSLSPHSLYRRDRITPGGVDVPLLVCGSADDIIVNANVLEKWRAWLQPGDELWMCSEGPHFFHYLYPSEVGRQIVRFWHHISLNRTNCEISALH